MLTLRLNLIRSNNVQVRSCIAKVNNLQSACRDKEFTLRHENERVKSIDSAKCCSFRYYKTITKKCRSQFQSIRAFSTQDLPKKADLFGDLSDCKYEKVEMDEDEKKEENFEKHEARIHRRHRLIPGGYVGQIKSKIEKGDLQGALDVLDLIKENRDKPTIYMYNLLLRAFAIAGDFKKCRSLYVTMKKRDMNRNAATYTSILNACANYHHSETALEYLNDLRLEFSEKNIQLNETHYHAMIKGYARHNNILEAFRLADEMRDKGLPTNEVTFNSLLYGAISDKEAGLRHALVVWHLMRRHRIQATLTTYNLLLRAIRDTKLGDLRVNDLLIEHPKGSCRIILSDDNSPDFLNDPPSIDTLLIKQTLAKTKNITDGKRREKNNAATASEDCLPATVNSNSDDKDIINVSLDEIHRNNRLILFGGVSGILKRMERDGVAPDIRTLTFLMELVPSSTANESSIVKIARPKGIKLDVDFFNMMMKKRTLRKDYEGAKSILDDIQRNGLYPDIITWGILAMGCQSLDDARTLIEGMEATGHRLNPVIAGTLINNACHKIKFNYILEIMETMKRKRVKPNWELYRSLDAFHEDLQKKIKSKKFGHTVSTPAFKTGYAKFIARYKTWQIEMERKPQQNSDDGRRRKSNDANRRNETRTAL